MKNFINIYYFKIGSYLNNTKINNLKTTLLYTNTMYNIFNIISIKVNI